MEADNHQPKDFSQPGNLINDLKLLYKASANYATINKAIT